MYTLNVLSLVRDSNHSSIGYACNPGIKHTGEADRGETLMIIVKSTVWPRRRKTNRKSLSGDKGFQKKSEPIDCNSEGNRSQN